MTGDFEDDLTNLEKRLALEDALNKDETPGTRPDLADEEREADELLLSLAMLVPEKAPSKDLFAGIEAQIDAEAAKEIQTVRADEAPWTNLADKFWKKAIIGDKIWKKILFEDADSGRCVYLLRCEAGAVIPPHKHARDEYVFVIEGEYTVDGNVIRAGDFQFGRAGSRHSEIRTANGCLVLISA